jgi:hypothetical protein
VHAYWCAPLRNYVLQKIKISAELRIWILFFAAIDEQTTFLPAQKNVWNKRRAPKLEDVRQLLSAPTILHDPTQRRFPLLIGMILRLIGADDFIQFSTSGSQGVC